MVYSLSDYNKMLLREQEYKYSAAIANLETGPRNKILKQTKLRVSPGDVYTATEKGYEDNPHITILYGLHTTNPEDVLPVFSGVRPFYVEVENVSYFEKSTCYVLILGIKKSSTLNKLHNALRYQPHTNNYPDYNPHITLAYIRKECDIDKKYIRDEFLEGYPKFLSIRKVIFSTPDGSKRIIPLQTSPSQLRVV